MKKIIQRMIPFLTTSHIMEYAKTIPFSIHEEEAGIIYHFIIDHYEELLDDERALLQLKPLIRDDLYEVILNEYHKNKSKYL